MWPGARGDVSAWVPFRRKAMKRGAHRSKPMRAPLESCSVSGGVAADSGEPAATPLLQVAYFRSTFTSPVAGSKVMVPPWNSAFSTPPSTDCVDVGAPSSPTSKPCLAQASAISSHSATEPVVSESVMMPLSNFT